MATPPEMMEGITGKLPTGYGSVSCEAKLNNNPLGIVWSKKYTHTEDTEHAEDQVVEYIQSLMACATMGGFFATSDRVVKEAGYLVKGENILEITNLTASPCTSVARTGHPITCKKINEEGCAEKLVGLQNAYTDYGITFKIVIRANHYFQPAVVGGKNASIAAAKYMKENGIDIVIA